MKKIKIKCRKCNDVRMYAEYSDKIKLSWTCDRCGHVNNRVLTAKNMGKTENE